MGYFKIEILAVGGHGDRREIGDGETLDLESLPPSSVDRAAYSTVELLRALGCTVWSATLTHWPDTPSEVVDDVLTQTRHGSF